MPLQAKFASRADRMTASEIRELLKLLDRPGILSFAGGIPDPDLFPTQAFSEAFTWAMSAQNSGPALQYSVSEGYLPLREWLARHMATIGVNCGPENILITSGSQQALDYLGKLFLSPRDTALVGWPTYLGALGAFNAYEPRYEQLSIRGNRSPKELMQEAEAAGGAVKFAYLSPDFANPTGETVDRAGREALLDMAEALDCAIIEDGAYQALRYQGEPVPPILSLELARQGHIDACRTIYCGSFSKTLSPGLRVGWVVAASPIIQQLVLIKQASDLHSATLNQMAVHHVAARHFDTHVETVRHAYAARRDALVAGLSDHMPKGVSWTEPEGGMFIWVTLPRGVDAAALLPRALEDANVAYVPGGAFFADGSGENTMRLSFSCLSPKDIENGAAQLGRVLHASM